MSNQLPDILNVKTLPTISNMEIKTEVLDPITASDNEIIFQLPKNGILDGGSFVSLAVTSANGENDAFFPINTGIHGLVKSAYLMRIMDTMQLWFVNLKHQNIGLLLNKLK